MVLVARVNFGLFQNDWVAFHVIYRFSANSDGSGGLGFKLQWCKNHARILSGGRFLNTLERDDLRDNVFACKLCF